MIGFLATLLFNLGPAAGLVGLAAGSALCWHLLVKVLAEDQGR